jgi:hypothetical protein
MMKTSGGKMGGRRTHCAIKIRTALATIMVATGSISAASATQASDESDVIIVRGYPLPDPRFGGVLELDVLTQGDIAAYGADTIGDMVGELAGELALAPLVLVNGRKISSLSEVADLPAESIQRAEVLPAQVALRYGGSSGQKVINFVLHPRFRSAIANLAGTLPTEGGGRDGNGAFTLTRIAGEDRLSLSGRAFAADALLEIERDIRPIATPDAADPRDPGRFRTLRPEARRYSLSGAIARDLGGTTVSATAKVDRETSRSLLGPASAGDPLEQKRRDVGGYAGLTVNSDLGRWWVSMTGDYDYRLTNTRTDQVTPVLGERIRDRTRSRSDYGGVRLIALGPLFKAPAGDVRVSVRAQLARSSLLARRTRPGLVERGELGRTEAEGGLNIEVPIARGPAGIGELSGHFNGGIQSVSDLRTLYSLGYGLDWAPRAGIHLTASVDEQRQPPSPIQLADPMVETSGVRIFDYVTGETAELTRVSGGNAELLADRRRTLRIGVNLVPLGASRLRISADYLRVRTDNPIAFLGAATAAIQSAFPDRFIRDADGALIRVDSRAVNFAQRNQQQMRWGFVFRRSNKWGAAGVGTGTDADDGDGSTLGFRLSLHHKWVLKDQILLRPGFPVVDLLHGGAIAGNGGRPRHELQWELGTHRHGLGARLIGNWRSGTVVREGDAAVERLRFSPLMQLDLRLFADVGGLTTAPWARGFRLSLGISNLLNDRQEVRDASGATPLSYQPAYLDPLGRTVSIGLRKLLF